MIWRNIWRIRYFRTNSESEQATSRSLCLLVTHKQYFILVTFLVLSSMRLLQVTLELFKMDARLILCRWSCTLNMWGLILGNRKICDVDFETFNACSYKFSSWKATFLCCILFWLLPSHLSLPLKTPFHSKRKSNYKGRNCAWVGDIYHWQKWRTNFFFFHVCEQVASGRGDCWQVGRNCKTDRLGERPYCILGNYFSNSVPRLFDIELDTGHFKRICWICANDTEFLTHSLLHCWPLSFLVS